MGIRLEVILLHFNLSYLKRHTAMQQQQKNCLLCTLILVQQNIFHGIIIFQLLELDDA